MTTNEIIEEIRSISPLNPEMALQRCRLPLRFLGDGAYRHVYHIIDTPLVIKFPVLRSNGMRATTNIQHAAAEYEMCQKIMRSKAKKFQAIQKHMPKLYYFNSCTGLILAHKYRLLTGKAGNAKRKELSELVCKALGVDDCDLRNSGNVGIDGRGTLKILDVGLLKQSANDWLGMTW